MALTGHRPDETSTAHARVSSVSTRSTPDTARAAFVLLRIGFAALPIVVGIDKFFDHYTDWTQYLWVGVPNTLHVSATNFMHAAGVVEIIAGVLVLVLPQIGGAVVAAWLAGIVANVALVAYDTHEYWDIALRDAGLCLGAVALALLATRYSPVVHRRNGARAPLDSTRTDASFGH